MGTSLRQSERLWGSIYALLHFLVFPGLFSWVNIFLRLPSWAISIWITFFNALCSCVIYRHFLLSSVKHGARHWKSLLSITALGLILYFAASKLFLQLAAAVYPPYANLNDGQVAGHLDQGGVLMLLCVVVAAPIGEEVIFRGLLFRGLYDRSPLAAWCCSVGLFSLVHLLNYIGLYSPAAFVLAFLQYLPAGICLALAFRLSGTILCPMLIHCIINLIGVLTLT